MIISFSCFVICQFLVELQYVYGKQSVHHHYVQTMFLLCKIIFLRALSISSIPFPLLLVNPFLLNKATGLEVTSLIRSPSAYQVLPAAV